jgi:hypothetical protein
MKIRNYRRWRWDRIIVVGWIIFVIFWLAYAPSNDTVASLLILSVSVVIIGFIFAFTMEERRVSVSTLEEHARVELEIIGEDEETTEGYLRVIKAFASMGHSGFSAAAGIHVLTRLLSFQNLSPLTDDENEWIDVSPYMMKPMWQSKRNPAAFSEDGGKSYILQSEEGPSQEKHISKSKAIADAEIKDEKEGNDTQELKP